MAPNGNFTWYGSCDFQDQNVVSKQEATTQRLFQVHGPGVEATKRSLIGHLPHTKVVYCTVHR